MNAIYIILSLFFGINLFGNAPAERTVTGLNSMNNKFDVKNQNNSSNHIINANPGTVVVLDDTHFSPPR